METTEIINNSIVEIYEREQPKLCELIKELVSKGETYNGFMTYISRTFGKNWKTSLTATASLTLFKHYSKKQPTE